MLLILLISINRYAKKKFEDSTLLIEEGGSHGYDEFETKMETIQDFFNL
jgi:predicted esterase YcpF (UPF0227 family)